MFSKKNIKLPRYSVDFHIHILHSIDDGPRLLEESIKMAEQLCKYNIHTAVATPHYTNGITGREYRELAKKRVGELRQELKEENIPLKVHLGYEVKASEELIYSKDIRELVIENTDYMLVEMPFYDELPWLDELIYTLTMLKVKPIIAHPERCECFQKNILLLEQLVDQDVMLQVNIGSLYGSYGNTAKKTAIKILNNQMLNLIGTDAHFANIDSIIPKDNLLIIDSDMSVCNNEKKVF